MERDTSLIPSYDDDCTVIVDDQTIIYYYPAVAPNDTEFFKLIGDKYIKVASEPYTAFPTTVVCQSHDYIQNMPSRYDFITPVYHLMAIISILTILYFAYRLIIYPFYRKKI